MGVLSDKGSAGAKTEEDELIEMQYSEREVQGFQSRGCHGFPWNALVL